MVGRRLIPIAEPYIDQGDIDGHPEKYAGRRSAPPRATGCGRPWQQSHNHFQHFFPPYRSGVSISEIGVKYLIILRKVGLLSEIPLLLRYACSFARKLGLVHNVQWQSSGPFLMSSDSAALIHHPRSPPPVRGDPLRQAPVRWLIFMGEPSRCGPEIRMLLKRGTGSI